MLMYPGMSPGNMLEYYRMLKCQLIWAPFVAAHLVQDVHSPQRFHLLGGLLQKPEGERLILLEAVVCCRSLSSSLTWSFSHFAGSIGPSFRYIAPIRRP